MAEILTLRVGDTKDVEQIRALTLRAYQKWVAITPRKPRPMTVDYSESIKTNRFDLLFDGDALVGLIETVRQDDELMIVNVAVEPDHQGRGFGVRLMKHAEMLARSASLRRTRLYTNKLMTTNISLYERLGYRFERETYHDLGAVAVHMVRPINQ